jgi:hypothetical protein
VAYVTAAQKIEIKQKVPRRHQRRKRRRKYEKKRRRDVVTAQGRQSNNNKKWSRFGSASDMSHVDGPTQLEKNTTTIQQQKTKVGEEKVGEGVRLPHSPLRITLAVTCI